MDPQPACLGGGELRGGPAAVRPARGAGRVLRLPERRAGGDPGAGRGLERGDPARPGRRRAARGSGRSAHGTPGPRDHPGGRGRADRAARVAAGGGRAGHRARIRGARARSGGRGALRASRRGPAVLHPAGAGGDRLPGTVRRRVAGHAVAGATRASAGGRTADDRESGPDRLRDLRRVSDHVADGRGGANRRRAIPELRGVGPRRHVVPAGDDGRGDDLRRVAGHPDRQVSAARPAPARHRSSGEPVHPARGHLRDAHRGRPDPALSAGAVRTRRGPERLGAPVRDAVGSGHRVPPPDPERRSARSAAVGHRRVGGLRGRDGCIPGTKGEAQARVGARALRVVEPLGDRAAFHRRGAGRAAPDAALPAPDVAAPALRVPAVGEEVPGETRDPGVDGGALQ